jgi:DNA processing protein
MRVPRLAEVCDGELWVRGSLPEIGVEQGGQTPRLAVALVGARAASRRAVEHAYEIAHDLAERQVVVVSGGALGVDAAAHRGALAAAGAPTVAVLGTGVDVAYPASHRALFQSIVDHDGALLSQFGPGTGPLRSHFPQRNVLIAALAHGVLVVEAQARSGALITARAARRLRRAVMAVPGSPGCDALLAAGAFAVESAEQVLAALEGRRRARSQPTGELMRVLEAVSEREATYVSQVAERVGEPVTVTHAALLRLTLMGYIARLPGERYKRLETAS